MVWKDWLAHWQHSEAIRKHLMPNQMLRLNAEVIWQLLMPRVDGEVINMAVSDAEVGC